MSTSFRLMSAVTASAFAAMIGSLAFGQETTGQQKCINTLNKDTSKVAATQGKNDRGCVKAASKGTPSATCVPNDGSGKVVTSEGKTTADETKNTCTTPPNAPDFGYSSASAGNAAAVNAEVKLFSDTYGTTDTTGVISTAKADAKCQGAVTKDLEKTIATKWKAYLACKKATLKAGASSAAALVSCVQGPDPNSIATDGKGKIAKTVTKLGADILKDCAGAGQIATDFPGSCSGSTTANLNTCLDTKAECRICQAINAIDSLSVDCDLFDDGLANNSCVSCGISSAGRYIQTTTGGSLTVSSFSPFPFPAGGKTVQDVSAPDANCLSSTVVPFPGACSSGTCTAGNTGASCTSNEDCNGLTVPVFCVPSLGYTVHVVETACGVGRIDSNGGSDFTITENGDTSYGPLNGCSAHQASCASGQDSSGDIDITVGDSTADTCSSGTGNAIVSIPVNTLTWLAADKACITATGADGAPCTTNAQCPSLKVCKGGTNQGTACTTNAQCTGGGLCVTQCTNSCPDLDGTFNAGTDSLITQFPQTLDLTTDTNTAQFTDNDADGCFLSGAGPAGPFANTGACIDFSGQTVSVAGSGTVFSSGSPLFDLLFSTTQDATIAGPTAFGSASCGVPPVINFTGLAHRCIIAP